MSGFSRDRMLHGAYKGCRCRASRSAKRQLQQELRQLALPAPQVECVDVLKLTMDLAALSAMARKRADLAAWEAAEKADKTPVCASTGYRVQRATKRPTDAETAAFLAWEREHLGVDRVAGTCVDPRTLRGGK